jgi:hypothetical protein
MKQEAIITILWIEDNPGLSDKEKVVIDSEEFEIPSLKTLDDNKENFSLKILQHPEEIKEYLSMCNKVAEKEGTFKLAEIDGVVPDIVVFDYMLSENFNTSGKHCISYAKGFKPVRVLFNPVYNLKEEFKETLFKDYELFPERSRNYKTEFFFRSINGQLTDEDNAVVEQDVQSTVNDEFGLFAGISVVRFFKDYVTCGLPATFNKKDRNTLQPTAKFYEWLNGYDLENALQRENKGKKDWKSILVDGVQLLRKRIETQIQTGKATPDYSLLNALAEGNISNERIFSFETIYGKRDLPLDGLFIDVARKDEQNKKINEWAKELLNKLPLTNAVIKKSNETATTLWNTYLNVFEDRIVLSDYSSRNGILNAIETAYLEEVKTRLGINTAGLIANECSIKTLLQSEKDKNVKRLTFLVAVTNATIELEKQRVESNFNEKYAAFTTYEYVNILFPKVNFKSSVLLSMNVTDKDKQTETERKWLSDNLTIDKSNKVTVGDIFKIEKWILKGEKEILKSLFYKDSKYFPQWLK